MKRPFLQEKDNLTNQRAGIQIQNLTSASPTTSIESCLHQQNVLKLIESECMLHNYLGYCILCKLFHSKLTFLDYKL